MSPRGLQNEIKQNFEADEATWLNYRDSIINNFATINYQDLSDHLLREFNRKIINLGLNEDLMFAPFDSGFRFLGNSISAAAYVAALKAAGATVTAPQQAAISSFMSGEIAAGRWDGIKRLYFPVWGLAAANAICMKSLTSGTFSGAMTHGAGFITSTGGILATNTNLPALGITVESHYLFGLSKNSVDNDFSSLISAFPEGVSLGRSDGELSARTKNGSITVNVDFECINSYGGSRTLRYLKRRLSSGVTLLGTDTSSVTGNFGTSTINLMGAGVNSSNFYGDVGIIGLGTALTDAEDTAFTASLKTLWETTTGLTLP